MLRLVTASSSPAGRAGGLEEGSHPLVRESDGQSGGLRVEVTSKHVNTGSIDR